MYSPNYDNPAIRSETHDSTEVVMPYLKPEMICLDLGCGTGSKTLKLAPSVVRIDAIDRNIPMLERTRVRQLDAGVNNIRCIIGDNLSLPFDRETYDVCTAFLTTWSAAEVRRVLRHDGIFIIECLNADDKFELKQAFGRDELGWRGRLLNWSREEHKVATLRRLGAFFQVERIEDISFETVLTREGLVALLEATPTVRNFDSHRDLAIVEQLTPDGFVKVFERRMMIVARA